MKITDINYLRNNGKYIDIIKHKDNTIWKRINEAFDGPGIILKYTASNNTTTPTYLFHGDSNYITDITCLGSGVYSYTISTDDITDLPTSFSFDKSNSTSYLLTVDYVRDTSKITDMREMFCYCYVLTSLDLSRFDTSNVTDMTFMFYNCSALTTLDVSNFDTSKVTNMWGMFYDCNALTTLDVSGFDTSSVTTMRSMFYGCSGLTTLDVSNFDTSNVTNMSSMFDGCTALTELDLSNFNTSNVTGMFRMFYNCNALTTLDLSNFDASNVSSTNDMFYNCEALTTLRLDNCSNDTIKEIITSSNFPTFSSGTHKIYCNQTNASGLWLPTGWTFSYV